MSEHNGSRSIVVSHMPGHIGNMVSTGASGDQWWTGPCHVMTGEIQVLSPVSGLSCQHIFSVSGSTGMLHW